MDRERRVRYADRERERVIVFVASACVIYIRKSNRQEHSARLCQLILFDAVVTTLARVCHVIYIRKSNRQEHSARLCRLILFDAVVTTLARVRQRVRSGYRYRLSKERQERKRHSTKRLVRMSRREKRERERERDRNSRLERSPREREVERERERKARKLLHPPQLAVAFGIETCRGF